MSITVDNSDAFTPQPTDKLARTDALDRLCAAILEGTMLTHIALEWGVSKSRLMYWIAADSNRSARVREARRAASLMYEEQAQEHILGAKDELELKRAKELAHHLRWRASKMNPRDYGEKLEVEQNVNLPEASTAQLAQVLDGMGLGAVARVLEKAATGKAEAVSRVH